MSEEERQCERHFIDTYSRDSSGRFILILPFKHNNLYFNKTIIIAEKRFLKLEKQLQVNLNLKVEYSKFLKEYEDLNHMQKSPIADSGENENSFYIPHHAVFKDKKIRVVSNGSSTAHGSASLNNCLHIGPSLQSNLISLRCLITYLMIGFLIKLKIYLNMIMYKNCLV